MITEAFQIARFFESIRDQWNQTRLNAEKSSDLEYAGLIAQYTTFLVKKIQFHHSHREFEGSLSLDTYAANLKTKNIQLKIGEGLIRFYLQ